MALTVTLNGSLARSTASYSREILHEIAFASADCTQEQWSRFLINKDVEGEPSNFPIDVPFGGVTTAKVVYIRVANNATIRLNNSAGATDHQSCDIKLGGPEGSLILFAVSVTSIQIITTDTDLSEVEVYIAGV